MTPNGRKYVLSSSIRVDILLSDESVEGSAILDKFGEIEYKNMLAELIGKQTFPKNIFFYS